MKFRLFGASVVLAAVLAGCSEDDVAFNDGDLNDTLVPPTASLAPTAPLQVPAYPPVGYNVNPSLAPTSLPAGSSSFIGNPTPPVTSRLVSQNAPLEPIIPPSRYDRYTPTGRFDRDYDYDRGYDRGYARGVSSARDRFEDVRRDESNPSVIPNSPILTPNNVLEISAVGMGVAPESTISPAQALALAKRAAIIDGYRQLGEKMYGIRLSGQDTVRDYVLQSSVTKARVESLIRNAEITETVYKDGLCQVSMEVKLDGRVWYRLLSPRR